jgi:hypothetical protein
MSTSTLRTAVRDLESSVLISASVSTRRGFSREPMLRALADAADAVAAHLPRPPSALYISMRTAATDEG